MNWDYYEKRKEQIQALNLPADLYEFEIKALIRRLENRKKKRPSKRKQNLDWPIRYF